jgi:hypothetical protein
VIRRRARWRSSTRTRGKLRWTRRHDDSPRTRSTRSARTGPTSAARGWRGGARRSRLRCVSNWQPESGSPSSASSTDRIASSRASSSTRGEGSLLAASFQLDTDGLIVRAMTYRTTPVPPASSWHEAPVADAADARRVLERYFSRLETGDVDGAASCFSADVLYAYPQAQPGLRRPVYVGREELRAAFVERGRRPWRHRMLTSVQRGRVCMVEGDVLGLEGGATGGWLSSVTLDADGLIARYCAFYAEPAIPRWGAARVRRRPPASAGGA